MDNIKDVALFVMLAYEILLCHGKKSVSFVWYQRTSIFSYGTVSTGHTDPTLPNAQFCIPRERICSLSNTFVITPKRPENYTIRWKLTVTHAIYKYLYAHSVVAVANGTYVTIFFVNTNYSYDNIPAFGTLCSEHPVHRHQSLTAYHNSCLLKSALSYTFRLS